MRVYKRLPEMLKWKKFFIWLSIAAAFIFYAHDSTFLLVTSLICLFFFAFLTLSYALASHIMGDSNDLRYLNKMFWYREGPVMKFGDASTWCEENLEGKWVYASRGYFLIKGDTDAMAFKLRWL